MALDFTADNLSKYGLDGIADAMVLHVLPLDMKDKFTTKHKAIAKGLSEEQQRQFVMQPGHVYLFIDETSESTGVTPDSCLKYSHNGIDRTDKRFASNEKVMQKIKGAVQGSMPTVITNKVLKNYFANQIMWKSMAHNSLKARMQQHVGKLVLYKPDDGGGFPKVILPLLSKGYIAICETNDKEIFTAYYLDKDNILRKSVISKDQVRGAISDTNHQVNLSRLSDIFEKNREKLPQSFSGQSLEKWVKQQIDYHDYIDFYTNKSSLNPATQQLPTQLSPHKEFVSTEPDRGPIAYAQQIMVDRSEVTGEQREQLEESVIAQEIQAYDNPGICNNAGTRFERDFDHIKALNNLFQQAAKQTQYHDSGAAGVGCIVHGTNVYLANVGNCRAVIYSPSSDETGELKPSECERITLDHSVQEPKEYERLVQHGAQVSPPYSLEQTKPSRLLAKHQTDPDEDSQQGLLTSRAFGSYNRYPGLSTEVEVGCLVLDRESFVILGSDGLYDALNEAEIRTVLDGEPDKTPKGIAQALKDAANAKGLRDDITVLVVPVKRPQPQQLDPQQGWTDQQYRQAKAQYNRQYHHQNSKPVFAAVFAGHDGPATAKYLADNMPLMLEEQYTTETLDTLQDDLLTDNKGFFDECFDTNIERPDEATTNIRQQRYFKKLLGENQQYADLQMLLDHYLSQKKHYAKVKLDEDPLVILAKELKENLGNSREYSKKLKLFKQIYVQELVLAPLTGLCQQLERDCYNTKTAAEVDEQSTQEYEKQLDQINQLNTKGGKVDDPEKDLVSNAERLKQTKFDPEIHEPVNAKQRQLVNLWHLKKQLADELALEANKLSVSQLRAGTEQIIKGELGTIVRETKSVVERANKPYVDDPARPDITWETDLKEKLKAIDDYENTTRSCRVFDKVVKGIGTLIGGLVGFVIGGAIVGGVGVAVGAISGPCAVVSGFIGMFSGTITGWSIGTAIGGGVGALIGNKVGAKLGTFSHRLFCKNKPRQDLIDAVTSETKANIKLQQQALKEASKCRTKHCDMLINASSSSLLVPPVRDVTEPYVHSK